MSDSDDSDFDPAAVAPSEIDSVAADAFHERDAVPDHECSDVERPPAREPPIMVNGRAVLGVKDSNGIDVDAGAKSKLVKEALVETKNTDVKKDGGCIDELKPKVKNISSSTENGNVEKHVEKNDGDVEPEGKKGSSNLPTNDAPVGETKISADVTSEEKKNKSNILVNGAASGGMKASAYVKPEEKKGSSNGAVIGDSKTNVDVKLVETKDSKMIGTTTHDAKTASDVQSGQKKFSNGLNKDEKEVNAAEVEKAVALAKAAAATVAKKQADTVNKSVDDLWKQMNQPVSRSQKRTVDAAGLGAWLNVQEKKPPKRVALPRLDEVAERSAREKEEADRAVREGEKKERERLSGKKRAKVGTGLEAVLKAAKGGDDGPSTLDRTKENWKEFKKTDESIEEELEAHKKDKNRYTDRVNFLKRTEIREWEVEQAGKKSRR